MSEEFDPYKAWLDIENKTASTTHYKLLGLPEFESDKNRITAAVDKAIRKIRSQRPGEHAAEWSKVLDELQEVKSVLLDDQKKNAYDDDLRFADEFVRELEGGMKRDLAAAAVAASAAPKKTDARPIKQDPRYPPGMAPKANSPSPVAKSTEDVELRIGPGPNPIERKDSPFYPPSRPAVDWTKPPAPEATPAPVTPAALAPTSTNDVLPPGAASSLPAIAPTVAPPMDSPSPMPGYFPQTPNYSPQQPAPFQQPAPTHYQPTGYPQQPPGYPQQAALYSQQPSPYSQQPAYPQQATYPPAYYPPPPGQAPMAAYPMSQPGYGYGPPMAQPMPQPMGYGTPGVPGHYGGMPPMAAPIYGTPMAMPVAPPAYMQPPPTPAALDPMAPVAIPGTVMAGGMTSPVPVAMPYGAPPASAAMLQPPSMAIPLGTAVATVEGSPPGSPSNTIATGTSDVPAKEVRSSSATAVMLAAKREKSSQQTLLFVGLGGLLLVVVSVLGLFAISGNFGRSQVANIPANNGGTNSPAVTPGNAPSNTVRPVSPGVPVSPPVKPQQPKPEEPEKTKVPEAKPTTEMPVETKPEPAKPEPTKPEPAKPEPTKPEPPKPEPKPEAPPGELPSQAEVLQLGKALQSAKAAVGEFNFAEADVELAKAEKLAKLPEHRNKLARLKEVKEYVKQFHERLVQAATGMEAAESFKIGSSTFVGMVDADQKQVILKIAGQSKTYQYSDLPVHLAAALADMKLDGTDPVSRVVKGAYVACNKASTPTQLTSAKEWWDEATLGGADVSHLMPFLTDSYDLSRDLENLKKVDPAAKPDAKGAPDAKAILEGKT